MRGRLVLCVVALGGCGEHGSPGRPADAPASGAVILPAPRSMDFGLVPVGTSSAPGEIAIEHIGPAAGNVTQVIIGRDGSAFQIEGSTCTAFADGSDSCTTRLRFVPATTSPQLVGMLLISTADAIASVALQGRSMTPSALAFSPAVHDYGPVSVGTTSATTFTMTNSTASTLSPILVSLAGTDAAQFAIATDTCTPSPLAVGASCTVNVAFSPTSTGARTAALQFGHPTVVATASLLGTGVSTTALAISPATFDFGVVTQGNSSLGRMFTITNTGGSTTGLLAVTLGGNHPGDFLKQADQCTNRMLASGASCSLFVTFEPGPVGARNARLQVSAAPGGSTAADLSGTCAP